MARIDAEKNKAYNREYMRRKREAAKAAGIALASDEWRKNNPDKSAEIDRRYAAKHPDRIKAKTARQKERLNLLGLKRTRTEEQKSALREYMRQRRAEAKAEGRTLQTDEWNRNNPDRRRETERVYRERNADRVLANGRVKQARRRSTPWGQINNRIWSIIHVAMKKTKQPSTSKYLVAFGYTWPDFRAHLEAQFTPDMTWSNWGDVWELDHIKPLSSFQYTSLEDPLFRECWCLSNLRPLSRAANATKGNKPTP